MAGRGGCQGEMMMTTMRSNEGGGAYRWADEGGPLGGCPTSTSSLRGRTQQEPTLVVCEEEQEEEQKHPLNPD